MAVQRIGYFRPDERLRDAEPVETAFRYYTDYPDESQAVFEVYAPLDEGGQAFVGWYLEEVGLITWVAADTLDEAQEWAAAQAAVRVSVAHGYDTEAR